MFGVYRYWIDVTEFKKIYIDIVTLTFDLEIQGKTWRNTFNMIFMIVYIVETWVCVYKHWIDVVEFIKKYINIVTLTFDLEMQGQTWRNTFNMIFMVEYIVETCVKCL